jgi:hypothetical protein
MAGGGGYSLKWSDGVTTQIEFGLQGRGTPVCPSQEQIAVDDTCGQKYYRSIKTLRPVDAGYGVMSCIQLDKNPSAGNLTTCHSGRSRSTK